MRIEKAKEMGFCFGVRRALKLVEKAAHEYGSVETWGALVHNQQIIHSLTQRGITAMESLDEVRGSIVAIPSHGLGPQMVEEIQARGLRILDTTCPIVRKAQIAAKELAQAGFWVIVFGDKDHPEVKGLLGWAEGKGIATLDSEMVKKFDLAPQVGILSQTTQSSTRFACFLTRLISSSLPQVKELRIVNTICDATRKRQEAALELAGRVDLMIVIGGRNSANTQCLAEACASTGVKTYHVEQAGEIEPEMILSQDRIGITAGASTPDQVIQEVLLHLEALNAA
jgi:4-hydroxy-3-methylbut-2-enyl diphosphate reductase